jgi:hypothetical protein
MARFTEQILDCPGLKKQEGMAGVFWLMRPIKVDVEQMTSCAKMIALQKKIRKKTRGTAKKDKRDSVNLRGRDS